VRGEGVELAALARQHRDVADLLADRAHGQRQRVDQHRDDAAYPRQEQQIARPWPTLIFVFQRFAARLGAGLPLRERAPQHHDRHQREQQIVHHQRIPAEGIRPPDRAARDERQPQRSAEGDAGLRGAPCRGQHGPCAHQHRPHHEDHKQQQHEMRLPSLDS
jgi:hypothetical protein